MVDFLRARPDVNAAKIALIGVSFGGVLTPRAVAFEHRLAALCTDPGVVDAIRSWHFPPQLLALVEKGLSREEAYAAVQQAAAAAWDEHADFRAELLGQPQVASLLSAGYCPAHTPLAVWGKCQTLRPLELRSVSSPRLTMRTVPLRGTVSSTQSPRRRFRYS